MATVNACFGDLRGLLDNPTLILAGGYVRDSALDKPIKDADFFISGPVAFHMHTKLRENGWKRKALDSYGSPYIKFVYTTKKYDIPCELIWTTVNPIEFVNRNFDWGLCKCYETYDDGTTFTDHFLHDYEQKRHTCEYDEGRHIAHTVMQHAKRLVAKYPWPLEMKV